MISSLQPCLHEILGPSINVIYFCHQGLGLELPGCESAHFALSPFSMATFLEGDHISGKVPDL